MALLVAALLHSVTRLTTLQNATLSGPLAARTALLRIAEETASAYAPPAGGNAQRRGETPTSSATAATNPPPFSLVLDDDPSRPRTTLSFLLPVPLGNPDFPGYFDLHRVTYLDRPSPPPARTRDLLRLSSPLLGPDASIVTTQLLYRAPFRLDVAVTPPPAPETPAPAPTASWPPPSPQTAATNAPAPPVLPATLTLTLSLPDAPPLTLTTPLHAAYTLPPLPK